MCPLPSTEIAAPSTGNDAGENGETPTPSFPVDGFGEGSVTPLSSLSTLVEPTNLNKEAREEEGAKEIANAPEGKGGLSEGFKPLGAKASVALYGDAEKCANLLDCGLSDIVRNGVMLWLELHGFPQGLNLDREAIAEAHRRLKEHQARAADLMPVVAAPKEALRELRQANKALLAPAYRTETMRSLARLKAQETATAVRMWTSPATRHIIKGVVQAESSLKESQRGRLGPPVLHPLRNHLGSYAALLDALVAETGVLA